MPLRLLVSARDPGAAVHLLPVIRDLGADPGFDLEVLAAPPGDRIFAAAGLDFERVPDRGPALNRHLMRTLDRFRPNAVLTGLSGPDAGLDEALLAVAAGRVPTFAYQDFWGDANLAGGTPADCYLVRDAYAARVTGQRHELPTVVVGAADAAASGRYRPGRRHRPPERHRVGWCGQPLWEVPGYTATFQTFARHFRDATLLIKPHPKEDRPGLAYRRLAPGRRIRIWRGSPEGLFAQCELVASAFSNCALEQARYNAPAARRPAIPVQLLFDPRLRAVYRQWTGLDRLPLVEQGLAVGVARRSMLGPALSERRLQRFAATARPGWRRLARPDDATARIAEVILRRVAETRRSGSNGHAD